MVNIRVDLERSSEFLSFSEEDQWTVEDAVDAIREKYGLINGGITKNDKVTRATHLIQEAPGVFYVFTGGKKKQTPQQGK